MIFDLIILGILLLFGWFGLRSGTARQVANWGGLALARVAGKPLALLLTLALAHDLGFPPLLFRVALSVLCFYTVYVVGSLIARLFLKNLAVHHRTRVDRFGGFTLGMGKGAAISYVALSLLIFLQWPAALFRAPSSALENSAFLRVVARHNFFQAAPLAALSKVEKLASAIRDPKSEASLSADPNFKELLADPTVKASLQDKDITQALSLGDWQALQRDPRIAALLKDPRIAGPLSDPLDYRDQ